MTSNFLAILLLATVGISYGMDPGGPSGADRPSSFELLPAPRHIEVLGDDFRPLAGSMIWAPESDQADVRRSLDLLQALLGEKGLPNQATSEWPAGRCGVILKIRPELVPQPEGYRIRVSRDRLTLSAHDTAGLHYAVLTLSQIVRQIPSGQPIPCMKINDWPDFAHRGVMLDVSRDKVPTMKTLYQLVNQ